VQSGQQISRPKVFCRNDTRNHTTSSDSLEMPAFEQYLEFIMDDVAVGQEFITKLRFSYVLKMFRTLIYPSSGACDYYVALPHWSYCSWFDVFWSFGMVRLEWYPCCRLKPATQLPLQPNHTETPKHIEPRLKPATRIPLQPNHTENPTHIEPRIIRPMW